MAPPSFAPLYVSHFLSAWGERMWEFAAALLLITAFRGSLRLPAVFGFSLSAVTVLFGGAIGDWVDRTNRLTVIRIAVVGQNLSVGLSAGSLMLLLHLQETDGSFDLHWWVRDGLAALTVIFGSLGALCAMASKVAIEQDWVAALAEGDELVLGVVNSRMRRIDLTCKILAPTAVGFLIAYDPIYGAGVIMIWNVGATYWEYAPVRALFLAAQEQLRKASNADADDSEAPAGADVAAAEVPETAKRARRGCYSCYASVVRVFSRLGGRSFAVYKRQFTFVPSVAIAVVYLTVLSFGTLVTAYLKWSGVPEALLGGARGIGAVFGLTSTFVFAPLRKCMGTGNAGALGVALQFICLLPCVAAAIYTAPWLRTVVSDAGLLPASDRQDPGWQPSWWVTDPSKASGVGVVPAVAVLMLMGGLILSRLGLWLFDLAVTQLMQVHVSKAERGAVNGVQQSLQQLFQMVSYGVGIVISRPEDFGWLMLGSVVVVGVGLVLMSVFACRSGSLGAAAKPVKPQRAAKETDGLITEPQTVAAEDVDVIAGGYGTGDGSDDGGAAAST